MPDAVTARSDNDERAAACVSRMVVFLCTVSAAPDPHCTLSAPFLLLCDHAWRTPWSAGLVRRGALALPTVEEA